MSVQIRPITAADWPMLWPILQATFAKGDTYTFPEDVAEASIRTAWLDAPRASFVAVDGAGAVLGTYYVKANQGGRGDHVANCGYVVAEAARGRGVASLMCEHSQTVARELGFRAMQFNFVVASNVGAVRLWQRHGFEIVGRLPGAFRHPRDGFVDALVMFKAIAT